MSTLSVLTEDAERLARQIKSVLEYRQAMNIGELSLRLGVDRTAVQTELEAMMARGEVERLRPIDYPREDHDFFRVNGHGGMTAKSDGRWFSQTVLDGQQHMRLAGKAMACLAD